MQPPLASDPALATVLVAVQASLRDVERVFDAQLASDLPPVTQLVRHIERYRGKMLRPTLVLVCGMASHPRAGEGGDPGSLVTPRHVAAAATCEMVHMATLVHDDVLDEADTRRRGDTVNRLHGNETAVILGDYLIASAYHLCSREAGNEAAIMVGHASMVTCSGELLQLHHRGDYSLDEATYFEIVGRKTAELIATSCSLGGLLSGASPEVRDSLHRFGRDLGVAFQIQDDLLDLTGTERTVGKSVGKDLEKGKMTLPLVHHLGQCSPAARGEALRLLERACGDFAAGDREAAIAAAELASRLEESGSVRHARQRALLLVETAREAILPLPPSPARDMLLAMADAVVNRAF
jgi:octaprenyl-diphosphate synthase